MFYCTQPEDPIIAGNLKNMAGNLREANRVSFPARIVPSNGERLVLFGHGSPEQMAVGKERLSGWQLSNFLWENGLRGEHEILLISCRTGKEAGAKGLAFELAKDLGARNITGFVKAPRGWVVGSRDLVGGLPQVLNSDPLARAVASGSNSKVQGVLSDFAQSFPMPPADAWRKFGVSKKASAALGVADILGLFS